MDESTTPAAFGYENNPAKFQGDRNSFQRRRGSAVSLNAPANLVTVANGGALAQSYNLRLQSVDGLTNATIPHGEQTLAPGATYQLDSVADAKGAVTLRAVNEQGQVIETVELEVGPGRMYLPLVKRQGFP